MGLISGFKRFFDLEEEESEQISSLKEEHPQDKKEATRFSHNKKDQAPTNSNVVRFTNSPKPSSQPILVEPTKYDDVLTIAEHLKQHKTVIFNVEQLDRGEATRVIDFLSGAVYLANGSIEKIDPKTFICAMSENEINRDLLKY